HEREPRLAVRSGCIEHHAYSASDKRRLGLSWGIDFRPQSEQWAGETGSVAICDAAWVELVEAADPAASDQSNQIPSSSAPSPGAQGGPAGAPSGQEEAGACCKAGDTTPPTQLVAKVPLGQLHSPYSDYAKLAKDDPDLVKQFRL